jgi:hypothetical protein
MKLVPPRLLRKSDIVRVAQILEVLMAAAEVMMRSPRPL